MSQQSQKEVEFKTIMLNTNTLDRLKRIRNHMDSYDQILNKVFDVFDGKRSRDSILVHD